MRSSSNSKRTFHIVRHIVVPFFLLVCLGLGLFWLWSLFLLITDYGSTHSSVEAGINLTPLPLSRTLVVGWLVGRGPMITNYVNNR